MIVRTGLLLLLAALVQTPSFQSDPPHKCDDCAAWNKAREPFKVFGNTYYVGTDGLSALLVTGEAGHVLLDAGLTQSAPLIHDNIRKLGFKAEDVKLIVVSHGHFDHAGGAASLQRATGATVAASASTVEALARGENTPDDPQFGFGKAFNGFPPFKGARTLSDGEVVEVGGVAITAHMIPGHAPGSTAYSWRSCDPGPPRRSSGGAEAGCLNMVYADSLTSPSAPGFKYGPARLEVFRRSIQKVAVLPCDIIVSPHPSFTQIDEKLKRRAESKGVGPDPFIDPNGCRRTPRRGSRGWKRGS